NCGRIVIAADVTDDESTRWCVIVGAVWISESYCPNGIPVWAAPIVERIVSRYRTIRIDAMNLSAWAAEVLCEISIKVLTSREVDLAIISKIDGAPVMLGIGILRVLIKNQFASCYRSGQRGICRKARQAIVIRGARCIEHVVEVVGREIRIKCDIVQP